MRHKKGFQVLALLVGVTLLAAACSDDDTTSATASGDASKTVNLAFVGPLTGDNANLGINIRNGAKTALDEYNKKGGPTKVVLKEFDTKGDPAEATTVKDSYVGDTSIIGIIGPTFSGETKAVLPSYDEAGLVMISASATNEDLPTVVPNSKVFHRVIADDTFQGKGIGAYIVDTLAGKTIVVVDDNSEYGKGLADDTTNADRGQGQDGGETPERRPEGAGLLRRRERRQGSQP